jgi:pimeloyl-ACP methyl ester carboxylesterase
MRYGRSLHIRLALAVIAALAVMAASCADDGDGDGDGDATARTTTTEQPTTTTTTGSPLDETTTTTEPATTTTDDVIELPVEVELVGDVAYTSERTLDVYAPAEGSGWPVVVYFHGGPPAPGRRTDAAARLQTLAAQGLVVYAPDWRSNGPAGGSQDSVCAIAYAEATAADHGGDAEAVTMSGYSTGGFTALVHGMLGPDAPLEVTDCEVDPNVTLPDAIAVGGTPVFAAEWARDGRLPLPAWTSLTPDELDLFDPYLLLGRNPDAIVAVAVGDDDQGGPAAPPGGWPITEANLDYHQRLIDTDYDTTLTTFPGGHVIEAGSEQEAAFVEMIVDVATATTAE